MHLSLSWNVLCTYYTFHNALLEGSLLSMFTGGSYALSKVPEHPRPKEIEGQSRYTIAIVRVTYAGHPMKMARAPRIESAFPRPSALYMVGANKGNPKPQTDRRNMTVAKAEHILVS